MGLMKKIHAAYDRCIDWVMDVTGLSTQPYRFPPQQIEQILDMLEDNYGSVWERANKHAARMVHVDSSLRFPSAAAYDRCRVRAVVLYEIHGHNVACMYEIPDCQIRTVRKAVDHIAKTSIDEQWGWV